MGKIMDLSICCKKLNELKNIYNEGRNSNQLAPQISSALNIILSEDYFIGFFIHFYENHKSTTLNKLYLSRWERSPTVKCPCKKGNSWLDGEIKFQNGEKFLLEVKAWNSNSIGDFTTLSQRVINSFLNPNPDDGDKDIKERVLKIACNEIDNDHNHHKRCLLIWPPLPAATDYNSNYEEIHEGLFCKINLPDDYKGIYKKSVYIFSVGKYIEELSNKRSDTSIKVAKKFLNFLNELKSFL